MEYEDLEKIQKTNISIFSSVSDNIPKDFSLEVWLLNTIKPFDEETKKLVLDYRETLDPELKKKLPCCTISASFKGKRSLDNIKEKNKLICIDVDRYAKGKRRKGNNFINMTLVKEMFMEHPCTYYVGTSVGGDGLYAILRIHDEERLNEYFEYFRDRFALIGVNIDESCKDYTRLRIFSYDPEAYFNPNALFYKLPKKKEQKKPTPRNGISLSDVEKVEKLINVIESNGMDITQSYEDWVKVGAALADGFGDMGCDYFHRISSFHPDYDYKVCQKKWEKCKQMNKIKLAALFYVASSYGVRY